MDVRSGDGEDDGVPVVDGRFVDVDVEPETPIV
jgi:hypothetical protein